MNETFLDKIIDSTRKRVAAIKASTDGDGLRSQAELIRKTRSSNSLRTALQQKDRVNIIAEFKRASPSKGVINDDVDIQTQVKTYEDGGACAISVLTEENYFKGSIDDLKIVRQAVDLPLLRKDFTIDEFQIYEAAAAGADAVLLIVAALESDELISLQALTNELGIDAIVEVHTVGELATAAEIGAQIIGVNNRNLKTFDVSLDVSRELIRHRAPNALMIAESGLSSAEQISELKALGFDGFLIGESLMRSSGSMQTLEALI